MDIHLSVLSRHFLNQLPPRVSLPKSGLLVKGISLYILLIQPFPPLFGILEYVYRAISLDLVSLDQRANC